MTEASPVRHPTPVPQRPAAPDVQFSRRAEAGAQDDRTACPLCGSRNQRGLRFCVTCGHLLAQRPSIAPSPDGAAPAARASIPPPIAPSRVVQLGEAPAPAAVTRTCPRCRGTVEGTGQFCRICGASLADVPPPAVPSPPATGAPTALALPPATGAPTAFPSPPAARPPSMRPAAPSPAIVPPPGTSAMFVSAPAPTRVRLVLIARDGGEGPSYPVGETTDIGRGEGQIIVGDDGYVSPRHARLSLRNGSYFLRDLGSINGIYLRIPFSVDGSPVAASKPGVPSQEQELGDQELFLVGQQVLRFEVVKQAEEGFGVASDNGTLLFGAPAASRYARLSQRTVEGVARDVFHLRKAETIIGRESGDIVFTDDPFLSRRHAVVRVHGTGVASKGPRRFTLSDLGSSNGTFLQLREEVRLRHGDHFRVGQQLFRFDLDVNRGA